MLLLFEEKRFQTTKEYIKGYLINREMAEKVAADIVRLGRVFNAIMIDRHGRELEVEPIDRRVTYHHVKAREVIGIWRKSRAKSSRGIEAVRAAA